MSLWSGLYVGTSGLQTGQNALNTIAHNLVNVDTKGYTRQQIQQSDKQYITISKTNSAISYQQTGLGVTYSNVKQVRDYFLDKTYRKESGRGGYYDISSEVLKEVEDQLGEMNGEAFQKTLTDLWTSVQELSKDPCSSVTQGTLVSEATEFLSRAQAVYNGLSDYQDNLNMQVKQQVEKINQYGKDILALNDQIRLIEVGGIERANDLRDVRNQKLDELAELCDMSYDEDMFGNVFVQIEGEDFVKGSMCYEIGLDIDATTGFYTPFWPQDAEYILDVFGNKIYQIDNAKVFDLDREISSELGTDVGKLKGMLLARGDHRATYQDMQGAEAYSKVSQSVIMNVQAEFDQMMHSIMTTVNDVLADAAGVTTVDKDYIDSLEATDTMKTAVLTSVDGTKDPIDLSNLKDGESYRIYCVDDNTVKGQNYLTDLDGRPLQMFNKITTESYDKYTGSDGKTYWVYNEEKANELDSLYTIGNTEINASLRQNPSLLGFRLPDGSEDNKTIEKLKDVFTEEKYYLNPKVLKSVSLIGYYDDLVAQVSNSSFVFNAIKENQDTTVEAALSARDQVTAVSSDEELSNMIKYQSAYNASSRYINVVNEMLEHLLNTLGA